MPCASEVSRHALARGLLALAALFVTVPADAQRIRGQLLDLSTDEPISLGILTLRSPAGERLRSVVTDRRGEWVIEAPSPGVYHIEASRIGYETWIAGPITLEQGDDYTAVFHLRPRPVQLPALEVAAQATRRHLEQAGFYARQKGNFGSFLTPERIAERRARTLTDLLLTVPGVRPVTMTTGSVGARYVQLRGSNLSHGGICRPRVYVDGLLFARGDSRPALRTGGEETELQMDPQNRVDQGLSLDDIGPPSDIAAIEIYRSASQVPVQFGGSSVETLCGVIVVWTRRGVPGVR